MNLAALGVPTVEFGDPVVDVDRTAWRRAAERARDEGLSYFDMLTAADDGAAFTVVAYLWAPRERAGVLLRTAVPRAEATLASITPVFPGADWHERETAEMFGIAFAGHPDPRPLLLPDPATSTDPYPLRKEHALRRREQTPWPGERGPR